jgi:glycosidase
MTGEFMKITLLFNFILVFCSITFAQVPVTFHYKPDYTEFQKLRLTGTFNGWNNADDDLLMSDSDGDGEYEVTVNLSTGVDHNYKFVMDADWGLAFNDPDNPRINLADNNNSILTVKDPVITYLLPRDVNSNGEKFIDNTPGGLPIRVIFAFTSDNPINLNSLTVSIDGVNVSNPSQHYNAQKKEFLYNPTPALTTGEHTISVTITSASGNDSRSSTFIRDPNYVAYEVPVDFYYDQYNSSISFSQTLNSVYAAGTFNGWNAVLNPMQDANKDGLWETTANLFPGTYEYKFKLNNLIWINDPDETKIAATTDANNIVIVKADSIPRMKLIQPLEGTVYSSDPSNINFQVLLRPGVKSEGINESTIQLKTDGATQPFSLDTSTSVLTSTFSFTGEERHTVEVLFSNAEGLTASEIYSYGIYTEDTGVLVIDAENDEPYTYPAGVSENSCDILSVNIDETANHDSLQFKIQLKDIDERTRVGFIISSSSKTLIDDPKGLDIKTMNWNNQGIFVSLSPPGNPYENTSVENRIMASSNPPLYSDLQIDVNSDALTTNSFDFKLSLALLDSIIGSWNQQRFFYAFSYIAMEDGSGNSYEVGVNEGGIDNAADPDIYDAAFIRSGFWQNRMFSNYIPGGQTGGPRFVALDGRGRGILSLSASDISDSLATFGPAITFLTPAVEYWYPDVTIYGELSDSTITEVKSYFNNSEQILPVTSGRFSLAVTLNEGENIFYVEAEDNRGYKSISKDLVLTYTPDNLPVASISGTVNGREVTLTANASSSAGTNFNYTWSADSRNPVPLNVSSTNQSIVVNMPLTEGEYFFNVRVRDAKNKIVNPRIMIVAKNDSVFIPDINYHSSWIDNAIVYEIYPRSFSDQGGFQGVADKIDYLKDLGINTIWFMPIYTGPTTHGYEITDYYGFEEDYGNESSFRTMLTTLKNNGIRVILDYVVNHTSVSHPFMQNVFEYREYSPYADFYLWNGEPGNSNYEFYFDWTSLPNLNHNNPDVRKYFIDVAKYWVSYYGIDGYRCDVAWGVEERNSQFWQDWRAALKNVKPEVFLEAEAGSDEPVFYQQRFDSANDWELRNKIIGALNGSVTLQTLHQEISRSYPSYARPFRFVENHDESRAAALFDIKRSLLMHTMLFTLNGVPLIYSGGEVGELTRRELIDWSDPNDVRPYFKNLISIRKSFVHNPVINLVNNSDNANVYSYASTSGEHNLITIANFKDEVKDITLDLSGLPFDGSSIYYLTDLTGEAVYEVTPSIRNAFPVSLDNFEAKVFYYGLDTVAVGVDDLAELDLPFEYKLFQNYPNPFNPSTKIKFQIKETGIVTLKVYDILGAEVVTLINEVKNPGIHEVNFNAANFSSGVYFYTLTTGNFSQTKKLLLMK